MRPIRRREWFADARHIIRGTTAAHSNTKLGVSGLEDAKKSRVTDPNVPSLEESKTENKEEKRIEKYETSKSAGRWTTILYRLATVGQGIYKESFLIDCSTPVLTTSP